MAMNEFRREVAILKACRDPNIVAFLVGACPSACLLASHSLAAAK